MGYYKINFEGAHGTDLFYVTKAKSQSQAKSNFYDDMAVTDKMTTKPSIVYTDFIKGLKPCSSIRVDGRKFWKGY